MTFAGERQGTIELHRHLVGASNSPFCSRSSRNWRAARMGPTVWELEGPTPILKMSKTLTAVMAMLKIFLQRQRELALPPTAAVLMVTVRSVAKRCI